jgi:hypothetical protein
MKFSKAVTVTATAYTAGVAAGKAAAHVDDEESKIYMPHTHGGDPDT